MSQSGTVLIVEDNELSLKMARSLLQNEGYKTLEASNADAGIRLARDHQPNLILMDMHLPVKSGYEASQELKKIPETRDIPIVAFTALAMEEEQKRALDQGCSGVISKPINIRNFAQSVETFMAAGGTPRRNTPSPTDQASTINEDASTCPQCRVKVEKATRDLEEFLYGASHDLQAPLRKIQQFAGLLEESITKGDAAQQESQVYLNKLSRSAGEMESLLQSLLVLSRIDRKGGSLTNCPLDETAARAINRYRDTIRDCGARVEVGRLDCVEADPHQIQLVFQELLENALKFRKEGQQSVIRIEGGRLDDAVYEIRVEDNGIGFAEGDGEQAFRPFQRLIGGGYTGHGIGLAIVKKIIERHQGKITAQSKPGVGTCFRIQLPLARQ